MARDQFITFANPVAPQDIQAELGVYLMHAGTVEPMDTVGLFRWIVTLPGPSEMSGIHRPDRWFEVVLQNHNTIADVITREQDEYVNVVAEGFAKRLARRLTGTLGLL